MYEKKFKKTPILLYLFEWLWIVSVFTLFLSCNGYHEEYLEIDTSVDNVSQIIVINGEIEKNKIAWVQISYSLDIDTLSTAAIPYENNAIVTLSKSDGTNEVLQFWKDGIYYGTNIKGNIGETYTLTIDMGGGKIYSASSTMISAPGYQDAWVNEGEKTEDNEKDEKGEKEEGSVYYSEEWIVNDPAATRNRYLFEWIRNGDHLVQKDWAIDDNRVVNINDGLRLFNPTIDIGSNEYTVFRASEIDKLTYDYFNMYEKIVRGIIGEDSQTPYNPVSNFGEGTMGNFRAVNFSEVVLLTPPIITGKAQSDQIVIAFPTNKYFSKYNLFWDTSSGITKESSNKVEEISYVSLNDNASFFHLNLNNGSTYYYRIEAKDSLGNVSLLSPEINIVLE